MNKEEAANFLGVSVRTLQRYTAQGRIAANYKPGKTNKEAVYDEKELARFKRELETATYPVRPSVTLGATSEVQGIARHEQGVSIAPVTLDTGDVRDTPEMRTRMLAAFEAMASPVRLTDKLTLTLTEASLLSGLSRNHLRQAIEEKKLKARIIGRGWRVKRDDLDAYVKKL